MKDKTRQKLYLTRIKGQLKGLQISDIKSFVSLSDCWNISNRQAKFIVNSVRVYEFFGYQWRIPLWDNELMDFWARVLLKFRINKKLYDNYLFERLFETYDVGFRKTNERKDTLIKSIAKRVLPRFVRNVFKKTEDNLQLLEIIKMYFKDNEIDANYLLGISAYAARLCIWMLTKENK